LRFSAASASPPGGETSRENEPEQNFQTRIPTVTITERFCGPARWIAMKMGSWVIIAVLLAILVATISLG
jgi:hypothetical protein